MVPLIDIEPGMVVAGRYVVSTVDRPWLDAEPQAGTVCTALDAILDEPVLIHVADADTSGDVLEAARRVSILGDKRIAPTLDVGHSNGLDFVASKRIAVTSLDEILPRSPLPEDSARALIGEIGTVLVAAARRGLFHMFLHPSAIGITAQGQVIVSGIGIDSALAQGNGLIDSQDYTPTRAARRDAHDLVQLFYASVTGYWPGTEAVNGIPAAPQDFSRISRVKALNPDISDGLSDFISGIVTGMDPGPGSVAEVLGYIDEWDTEILRYVRRAPTTENDNLFANSPRSFEEATSLPPARATSMGGASSPASEDQVEAALIRIGVTRPGTRGLAAGRTGGSTGRYADRMQMRQASSFPIGASQIDKAAKDWEEWQPEQTYSQYSGYVEREQDVNLTTPIMNRDDADPDTQALDIVSGPEDQPDDTKVILDSEDDDGSWFLGGMFETNEQQREQQLREYERERRIARAQEETARRRLEAAQAAAGPNAARTVPAAQMRKLSPDGYDSSAAPRVGNQANAAHEPRVGNEGNGSAIVAGIGSAAAAGAGFAAARAQTVRQDGHSPQAENPSQAGSSAQTGKSVARPQGTAATGHQAVPTESDTPTESGGARSGAATRPKVAPAVPAAAVAASPIAGAQGSGSGNRPTAGEAAAAGAGGTGSGTGAGNESRSRRKPILWLVLALVLVIAIVLGFMFFNRDSGESGPAPVADSPTESPAPEKPTKKPAEETVPPKIVDVSAIDPEGDDEEHSDSAEDVIKGKKGTWRTDTYNSAEFGNLKSGVGLVLELDKKTTVKSLDIDSVKSGGKFEIRTGKDPEDSKKVGEGEFDSEGTTVKLDKGVKTDTLLLWITELPSVDDGFRAEISTITPK